MFFLYLHFILHITKNKKTFWLKAFFTVKCLLPYLSCDLLLLFCVFKCNISFASRLLNHQFLVTPNSHLISDEHKPGSINSVSSESLRESAWHCSFDLNLVQIPGNMPPNVKAKVIHYFMSKEKNFTLNQPWRLSWHLETPSLSSHMASFNSTANVLSHNTKKVLKKL